MKEYKVGQRWSYHTRPEDPGSTLIIGKIEPELALIHIVIEQVTLPDSPKPGHTLPDSTKVGTISHLPFAQQAIDESVITLLEEGVAISENFTKDFEVIGRSEWFGENVAATLSDLFGTLTRATAVDPFDDLVEQMRHGRSPTVLKDLYQRLFSLPEWFFLCRPDVDDVPIQWDFIVGKESLPAVLGFTSKAKAITTATTLNLYSGGNVRLMPADIDKTILWLESDQCNCEWVCFNFPDYQFPLYVVDAARLNLKR